MVSAHDSMTARRLNIKRKAAALEAAEAQRRFQAETLGEAAQPAEGPNQDCFLQQLTGRVRPARTRPNRNSSCQLGCRCRFTTCRRRDLPSQHPGRARLQ